MKKLISKILTITAATLTLVSVSTNAHADLTCEDKGLTFWEKNVNVTANWQTALSQGLNSGTSLAAIFTNFQTTSCQAFYAPTLAGRLSAGILHDKSCSVTKPNEVVSGTSIDYGGNASSNPANMRQIACVKKLQPVLARRASSGLVQ